MNSCHCFIQLSCGDFFFGSSLSALQVSVAFLPRHCDYFHDQNLYSLVPLELESSFQSIQPFRENWNWVEAKERGIPRKKLPQGLWFQLHSCLCYCLFRKLLRKGLPAGQRKFLAWEQQ